MQHIKSKKFNVTMIVVELILFIVLSTTYRALACYACVTWCGNSWYHLIHTNFLTSSFIFLFFFLGKF